MPIEDQVWSISYVFDDWGVQLLLMNSTWVDLITLLMSLERTVALWFPLKFHLVNTKFKALMCIAVSGSISSSFLIDMLEYHVDGSEHG